MFDGLRNILRGILSHNLRSRGVFKYSPNCGKLIASLITGTLEVFLSSFFSCSNDTGCVNVKRLISINF